jgi:hypothetical protein
MYIQFTLQSQNQNIIFFPPLDKDACQTIVFSFQKYNFDITYKFTLEQLIYLFNAIAHL